MGKVLRDRFCMKFLYFFGSTILEITIDLWELSDEKKTERSSGKKEGLTDWFKYLYQSVQWLSRVRLFATPWTVACRASLSIGNIPSIIFLS